MQAIIDRLEAAATWGCGAVNTVWEMLVYLSLVGYAQRYAEYLSDYARGFFGV